MLSIIKTYSFFTERHFKNPSDCFIFQNMFKLYNWRRYENRSKREYLLDRSQ